MRAIRTQIHGNLHLGRLLWDGTRFALLDVAGDLSQPVDARLIKRSPLRDIASLLLSLDEIAYEAAVEAAHRANAAPRAFANWAERWFVAMAAVLWHTYRARLQELAPSTGIVPDEPAEAEPEPLTLAKRTTKSFTLLIGLWTDMLIPLEPYR